MENKLIHIFFHIIASCQCDYFHLIHNALGKNFKRPFQEMSTKENPEYGFAVHTQTRIECEKQHESHEL